jgi:hypothetical protein
MSPQLSTEQEASVVISNEFGVLQIHSICISAEVCTSCGHLRIRAQKRVVQTQGRGAVCAV